MAPTMDSEACVTVDWAVEAHGDVALVTVELTNPTPDPRRVRVENLLDGPVLPPRRQTAPERGWTDDGYEGVVPADGRLPLGYASPAPVERPPVDVTDEGRASESDPDATPDAVVRALGDPSPPSDAVPDTPDRGDESESGGRTGATEPDAGTTDGEDRPVDGCPGHDAVETVDGEGTTDRKRRATVDEGGVTDGTREETVDERPEETADREAIPDDLDAWFAGVSRRLERGERLDGASVSEAADVLAAVGGLAGVEELDERLDSDAAALRAVARRAERLAERAERADVPVGALRRLA